MNTTIWVSKEFSNELQQLKRELKKDSVEKLIKMLVEYYKNREED